MDSISVIFGVVDNIEANRSLIRAELAVAPVPLFGAKELIVVSPSSLDGLALEVPSDLVVVLTVVELPVELDVAFVEPISPLGLVSVRLEMGPELAILAPLPLGDLTSALLGPGLNFLATVHCHGKVLGIVESQGEVGGRSLARQVEAHFVPARSGHRHRESITLGVVNVRVVA